MLNYVETAVSIRKLLPYSSPVPLAFSENLYMFSLVSTMLPCGWQTNQLCIYNENNS